MPADSAKRPQQLARLDLAAERQKSAKFKAAPAQNPAIDKKNRPSNQSATTAKKATKADKPPAKNSKIVVASHDQFNDIGDAAKATAAKSKPAVGGKPRPASAGVSPTKPNAPARPASAGQASASSKQAKPAVAKGGDSQRRLEFSPNEEAAKPNEDDDEDTEPAGGDNEPEAKGLYGVFVQTRRCERLCYEVGLKLKHIRKMKKKFDDNDMYHTGEITQAEFFFIINEDRRPLTKGILQYGGVSPDQKFMSFDEYLLCVVSFAVLTPPEVYQFAFDLYDADRSGTLDEYEFAKMSKEMQSKQFSFPKNTELAIKMIEGNDPTGAKRAHATEDGLVDLGEFMKFAKFFPMAFFPLFNFQKNVRRATLGLSKWSSLAARKLKIQELVSHMRRNYGAIPELSLGERLWSIVDDGVMAIRKRASEIYGMELNQRRLIGEDED